MDALAPGIGSRRCTCTWSRAASTGSTALPPLPSPESDRERGRVREGDLRRYGALRHAGFGLGFECTLAYVTGLSNVRDAIPCLIRGTLRYSGNDVCLRRQAVLRGKRTLVSRNPIHLAAGSRPLLIARADA
jgi:tRNA synthetases class II (D, K and N)